MFDFENELCAVRDALSTARIPYALCGGWAMIVHGFIRNTVDIDFLIREEDLDAVERIAGELGFVIKARPMNFNGGTMKIRRVSKIDPRDGETLMLDLLLVTPKSEHVWASREVLPWNGADLWVVSRKGLIDLKRGRSSEQDLLDIKKLKEEA
jgi:hypothetical protein